jgi:hypothetical protein
MSALFSAASTRRTQVQGFTAEQAVGAVLLLRGPLQKSEQ